MDIKLLTFIKFDKIGNTLVIIKTTKGKFFGGYTALTWKTIKSGKYK